VTRKLQANYDKVKKERDFHRMHHKRISQEKAKIQQDFKALEQKLAKCIPQLEEAKRIAEQAKKEKLLLQMENSKLTKKVVHPTYPLRRIFSSFS
jgi:regulator of replication initiation timing